MEQALPGKDSVSKSMNQMIDYADHLKEGFALEAEGKPAGEPRNRAEWAKIWQPKYESRELPEQKTSYNPMAKSYQAQAIHFPATC